MFGSEKNTDSIDDFTELEGGANLYEICESKKVSGASNSELREYLKENGLPENEIREWIRQIDSDFLAGRLVKKEVKVSLAVTVILGAVLIFIGLGIILVQLLIGFISIWLVFVAVGIISAGMGLVSKDAIQKKYGIRQARKFSSRYKDTSISKKL